MDGVAIDIFGTAVRMFVTLGAILGIAGAGLYLFRRSAWGARFCRPRPELIQVLSRCSLSPRESLCLVRVGTEIVLLGHSGSQITLLLRFRENPEDEIWKAASHIEQVNGGGRFLEPCVTSERVDALRREG
ncbi:MAG: FliO/MopB family protein [Candidatus Methylomirabilales bacterium]